MAHKRKPSAPVGDKKQKRYWEVLIINLGSFIEHCKTGISQRPSGVFLLNVNDLVELLTVKRSGYMVGSGSERCGFKSWLLYRLAVGRVCSGMLEPPVTAGW